MKTKSVLKTVVLKNVTHTKLVGVYLHNENSSSEPRPPPKTNQIPHPEPILQRTPQSFKNQAGNYF